MEINKPSLGRARVGGDRDPLDVVECVLCAMRARNQGRNALHQTGQVSARYAREEEKGVEGLPATRRPS